MEAVRSELYLCSCSLSFCVEFRPLFPVVIVKEPHERQEGSLCLWTSVTAARALSARTRYMSMNPQMSLHVDSGSSNP